MSEEALSGAENPSPATEQLQVVTFNYIKSGYFRVLHVSGAIGGPLPTLDGIHMAVFSERLPIPVQVTQELNNNIPGKVVNIVARKDVVREVEADLILDLQTAESIAKWILEQVETAKREKPKESTT